SFWPAFALGVEAWFKARATGPGVVGLGSVGIGLWYFGVKFPAPEWPWDLVVALSYFFVAWMVIFVLRLIFVAPYQLYRKYWRPPVLTQLNILCGNRAANPAFSAEGRSRSSRRSCEEYLSMGKRQSEMDRRQFGRDGEREISRQNRNDGRLLLGCRERTTLRGN